MKLLDVTDDFLANNNKNKYNHENNHNNQSKDNTSTEEKIRISSV